MTQYYKFRKNNKQKTKKISMEFWKSYSKYLKRLFKEEFFTENFGHTEDFHQWRFNFNLDAFSDRMIEEIGINFDIYYYDHSSKPSDDDILTIIEFAYHYISKPTKYLSGPDGDLIPSAFDSRQARYDYTIRINELFNNHRNSYFLKKGIVKNIPSKQLNDLYEKTLDNCSEDELIRLIKKSYLRFSNKTNDEKDEALNLIANALERTKTLANGDKKNSIKKIINNISEEERILKDINDLILKITKISNNYRIRHHETNKIEIKSDEIKNFLYYNYLNIINLLLSHFNLGI